jgi:hypothetical protein
LPDGQYGITQVAQEQITGLYPIQAIGCSRLIGSGKGTQMEGKPALSEKFKNGLNFESGTGLMALIAAGREMGCQRAMQRKGGTILKKKPSKIGKDCWASGAGTNSAQVSSDEGL